MSFYKSSVKTNLIDPVLNVNNRRAEFRFGEDQVLLSNMRIANIGITADPSLDYNYGAGAYSVIKSIHLYDGNQVLDQMFHFDKYSAWKNYLRDNSNNKSLNHFLNGSGMGYSIQGVDTSTNSSLIDSDNNGPNTYTNDATTTFNSWLDLKACLPFLQNSLILPTAIFKNLRVVIEFNSAVGSAQNTTRPLLIADEMEDTTTKNSLVSQYKGLNFVGVEHDSLVIDPVFSSGDTADKVQNVSQMLKGFDNKILNRFFVVKESAGADLSSRGSLLGLLGSQLCFREKGNVRVNGRTLLVGDGLDTPAKSLASVSDIYGTANAFRNALKTPLDSNGQPVIGVNLQEIQGQQDYRCFRVAERVEQMEYQFSRQGIWDTDLATSNGKTINCQMVLHFFGEVPKVLSVNSNGTYLIANA